MRWTTGDEEIDWEEAGGAVVDLRMIDERPAPARTEKRKSFPLSLRAARQHGIMRHESHRSTISFTRRGMRALRTTSGFTLRRKSSSTTGDSWIMCSIWLRRCVQREF